MQSNWHSLTQAMISDRNLLGENAYMQIDSNCSWCRKQSSSNQTSENWTGAEVFQNWVTL